MMTSYDSLGKDGIDNTLVSIVLPGADVSHQVAHAGLQLLEVHLGTEVAHVGHTCIEQIIYCWLLPACRSNTELALFS